MKETKLLESPELTDLTENKSDTTFPMKRIKMNILNVGFGIICHQVNARGVMGAGLAGQVKQYFPGAFQDYRDAYDSGTLKLGNVVISQIKPYNFIAHIVGQHDYGRSAVFTNYQALGLALSSLKTFRETLDRDVPIFFPYRMGSGLGGGKWRIVKDVIEEHFPDAIICQL